MNNSKSNWWLISVILGLGFILTLKTNSAVLNKPHIDPYAEALDLLTDSYGKTWVFESFELNNAPHEIHDSECRLEGRELVLYSDFMYKSDTSCAAIGKFSAPEIFLFKDTIIDTNFALDARPGTKYLIKIFGTKYNIDYLSEDTLKLSTSYFSEGYDARRDTTYHLHLKSTMVYVHYRNDG